GGPRDHWRWGPLVLMSCASPCHLDARMLVSDTPATFSPLARQCTGVSDTAYEASRTRCPAPVLPRYETLRARACRRDRSGQLEGGQPPQGAERAWWRARADRRGRSGLAGRHGRLKNSLSINLSTNQSSHGKPTSTGLHASHQPVQFDPVLRSAATTS